MRFLSCRTGIKVIVFLITITGALYGLSDGPPFGFTGGFEERTCIVCHRSYDLDAGREMGGDFFIEDLPDEYIPGQVYNLSVVIYHPNQRRWGFQLAARDETGAQAGTIRQLDGDDTTAINPSSLDIQYLQHTRVGTQEGVVTGPVYWSFDWVAPDEDVGPVYFNAAGVAANGDGEADGDYVYTIEQVSLPAQTAP